MSDRTDREKYLIILDRFYRGRGGSLLTKDESEALKYAISSIKTDLKYDLLYEETTHIADADKKIEPTTKNDLAVDVPDNNVGKIEPTIKNDLGVDLISRADVLKLIYDYKDNHFENRKEYPINYGTLLDMIRWVRALPSVAPQLSSELEKNSKKLEKDFGESDCISREAVLDVIERGQFKGDAISEIEKLLPITPQEPRKGHWIPVFQGDEIIDYRCSCCEFGNTFGKGTVGMNYCPRCGNRNEVEE